MRLTFLSIIIAAILFVSSAMFAQSNTNVLERLEADFKEYLLKPELLAYLKISSDTLLKSVHKTAVYFGPGILRDSVDSMLRQYLAQSKADKTLQTYIVFVCFDLVFEVSEAADVYNNYDDIPYKGETTFSDAFIEDDIFEYMFDLEDTFKKLLKSDHAIRRTHPKYKDEYYASGARRVVNDSVLLGSGKQYLLYENGKTQEIREYNFFRFHGLAKAFYENGKINFERFYKDGKMNGLEKAFYESGKPQHEINFKDDLRDGKSIGWYETGEKQFEGSFVAGTGKVTNYYRSGKINFERSYKDGKMDGLEKGFYESGKPQYEINFKNNLKESQKEYNEDGKLKCRYEYSYQNDKEILKKRFDYYPETGILRRELLFVNGYEDGIQRTFNENGDKFDEYTAVNGLIEGKRHTWISGKLNSIKNYKNGSILSETVYRNNGNLRYERSYQEVAEPKKLIEVTDETDFNYYSRHNSSSSITEGLQKNYHENGKLHSEWTEKNGKILDKYFSWYNNGAKKIEGYFNDESGNLKCYNKQGNIVDNMTITNRPRTDYFGGERNSHVFYDLSLINNNLDIYELDAELQKMLNEAKNDVYVLKIVLDLKDGSQMSFESGTGFLLSDGRFVTALHAVNPRLYAGMEGIGRNFGEFEDTTNGKMIATNEAGKKLEFNLSQFTNSKIIDTDNDWSYIQTTERGKISADIELSKIPQLSQEEKQKRADAFKKTGEAFFVGEEMYYLLGYPSAIGGNNRKMLFAFARNRSIFNDGGNIMFEQVTRGGSSGCPVFTHKNNKLVVVGIYSNGGFNGDEACRIYKIYER